MCCAVLCCAVLSQLFLDCLLGRPLQPPAGTASGTSVARDAGDAIDLTDDTTPSAASQPPAPSASAPAASAQASVPALFSVLMRV